MIPCAQIAATTVLIALAAACAPITAQPEAAGLYRLDYSGVYGVGRIDLTLAGGKVSGLNGAGAGPSYRGTYRQARDARLVQLDLIVHLPPTRQIIDGVVVIGTARDVPVRFTFPAELDAEARWPIRIETQAGPVIGTVARLP